MSDIRTRPATKEYRRNLNIGCKDCGRSLEGHPEGAIWCKRCLDEDAILHEKVRKMEMSPAEADIFRMLRLEGKAKRTPQRIDIRRRLKETP